MDESDGDFDLSDAIGSVIEVDLDAETEEVTAEPAEPTPDGVADEDPQHPEDSDDDAETPTPNEMEPFSFTAYGTHFDVPGAVIQKLDDGEGGTAEWIAMPRSAFQESVQPHLADLSVIRRNEETAKRTIAELNPERNPVVIEAMSLLEGWAKVQELNPDDLAAWIDDGKNNMGRLKLEAENKALREAREPVADAEPDYSELISQVEGDLPGQVELAMQRVGVELPRSVQKEVSDRLWSRIQRGEGVYVQGEQYGLEPGQLGVLHAVIDEAVKDAVGRREAGATQAEKHNAPKPKAPRQVSVKDSPAPSVEPKTYGTRSEWEADMGLN